MHCFRNIIKHDRILCKENTCRWGFLWLMLSLQTPNFRIEHQTRQIWTRTAKQRCAATAETYLKLLLFFGVHSLHGCSAILRVAFYWSLPSAQCLLQNQKKFQLSLPLWFCSMSACACLLLFSTLCTGAAKALFPKKINIICYACLPPALAGKVQLLLNSLRSWAGLLQAGKMTKCSKHRLDQAVRLSVRRRNASGTVGGSRSTIA